MKPTAVLLLLLATTVLTACGPSAGAVSPLVGGWAPPGQACDSPGGVFYGKDGTWAGYDVVGRWTLAGDRLTTRVTERGGYDRPARKVEGERPSTATVLSLSRADLTLRLADGSTLALKRCRG